MRHPGKEIALRPACQVIPLTVDIALDDFGYFQKLSPFRLAQVELFRIRRIGDTARIFTAVIQRYCQAACAGRDYKEIILLLTFRASCKNTEAAVQACGILLIFLLCKILCSAAYPVFRPAVPLIGHMYRIELRVRLRYQNIRKPVMGSQLHQQDGQNSSHIAAFVKKVKDKRNHGNPPLIGNTDYFINLRLPAETFKLFPGQILIEYRYTAAAVFRIGQRPGGPVHKC